MAVSDQSLPSGISARPLTEADLEAASALSLEAGWNQVTADWRLFLQIGRAICLTRNEKPVATAAILPYASRFAWISMVLVTAAERRQGLARWLLRHCMDDILQHGLVPVLDATPAGRAVYLNLGFRDTWDMHRLTGRCGQFAANPVEAVTVRHLREGDWAQIGDLDKTVFGADRGALLRSLAQRLPQASLVAVQNERLIGFCFGRDGRVMTQLGPLVAADSDTAIMLAAEALSSISGQAAIDVPDRHATLVRWLSERGFSPERPLTRMVYRSASSFDDTTRQFAIAGPELG
jgi:GNAT superfamily N-acetyltransferase